MTDYQKWLHAKRMRQISRLVIGGEKGNLKAWLCKKCDSGFIGKQSVLKWDGIQGGGTVISNPSCPDCEDNKEVIESEAVYLKFKSEYDEWQQEIAEKEKEKKRKIIAILMAAFFLVAVIKIILKLIN